MTAPDTAPTASPRAGRASGGRSYHVARSRPGRSASAAPGSAPLRVASSACRACWSSGDSTREPRTTRRPSTTYSAITASVHKAGNGADPVPRPMTIAGFSATVTSRTPGCHPVSGVLRSKRRATPYGPCAYAWKKPRCRLRSREVRPRCGAKAIPENDDGPAAAGWTRPHDARLHTDPWRVLRIQAEFVEGFFGLLAEAWQARSRCSGRPARCREAGSMSAPSRSVLAWPRQATPLLLAWWPTAHHGGGEQAARSARAAISVGLGIETAHRSRGPRTTTSRSVWSSGTSSTARQSS